MNQSSLLLYWQSVIIQQSVNYGNKISSTNRQIMLEISVTNPRNTQAYICRVVLTPSAHGQYGLQKHPPSQRLQISLFTCLLGEVWILYNFTDPCSSLQVMGCTSHRRDSCFPSKVCPVMSFHTFIFFSSLAPALCQVFL